MRVEHAARFDASLEDVREYLVDLGAKRSRAAGSISSSLSRLGRREKSCKSTDGVKGSELHDQARANPRSPCSSRLEAERRAFGPSTKRLPRRSGLGDCGSCPTSSHRPNRLHRAPEDRGGFTQVRSSWLKERPVVRHVCEAATARPTGSATHWRKKAKRRPRPSQRSSMGSRKPSARMVTRPSSAAPA